MLVRVIDKIRDARLSLSALQDMQPHDEAKKQSTIARSSRPCEIQFRTSHHESHRNVDHVRLISDHQCGRLGTRDIINVLASFHEIVVSSTTNGVRGIRAS